MYVLLIIILIYFIYYKYETIIAKESITDNFENYKLNPYIKMSVPIYLEKYSIISDEINTIPYYISNSLKFIIGDIKLKVVTKTNENINRTNIGDINLGIYNLGICTEYELLKLANMKHPNGLVPLKNIRVVCSLNKSYVFLIVHDTSGVKSLKDLIGKTIGITSRYSGSYSILKELCDIMGFKLKNITNKNINDINTIYFKTEGINQLFNMFFQKDIECLFIVSSHNLPYIFSLTEKIQIRLLDINESEFDIFNKKTSSEFFFLTRTRINIEPYNTFNNSRYLDTFYTRNILICNSSIPTKSIYNITKNIFNNIDTIKSTIVKIGKRYFDETQDPLYDDFKKEYMVYSNYKLQLHKGSYLYYKELNMFVDKEQKCEFFNNKCNILPFEKIKPHSISILN